MDFVKVVIPYDKVLSDAQIQQLAVASVLGGAKVEATVNGETTYSNISNNANTYNMLTFDVVAYIISLGGNVINYQSYIEIDLTANVPNFIRDFEVLDFEGNATNLTWAEWINSNQSAIEINGKHYISGYAHYAGFKSSEKPNKHLDGKELTALRVAGYAVLNKAEFVTLQNNNTDEN